VAVAIVLAVVIMAACGSAHRIVAPTGTPATGRATITGHVSWPDCPSGGASCPPVGDIPVHFADAAANQTYTAVSDSSGRYSVQVPPGSYVVIAGDADRSPLQRQLTVRSGESITLDLPISLPTGRAR
jgi:hypothetical protein